MKHSVWKRFAALMSAMVCCLVFAGQGEYAVLAETFGGIDLLSQLRAWAADEVTIVASGECGAEGDNLTWTLDSEGLLTISGEGEMADWESYADVPWCEIRQDITDVKIENSVKSIGDNAFCGCSLTTIVIPNGVMSIGNGVFDACNALEMIYVSEGNAAYKDVDGVLFSKDGTMIVRFPEGKSCDIYTIPDSVVSIGENAFFLLSLTVLHYNSG